MKKVYLLIAFALMAQFSIAQSREGNIDYQKTSQHAAIIEIPFSPGTVKGALKEHFAKQSAKPGDSKGFYTFKAVRIEEGDTNPLYDLYFKIEEKSRKERDISVIYLTNGHPGENLAVRMPDDRYGQDDAKIFLNSLQPKVEAYDLENQIKTQDEVIIKADKKNSGLIDDSISLQKKKVELEGKIAANSKSQEDQRKEVQRQRDILEALKARRK